MILLCRKKILFCILILFLLLIGCAKGEDIHESQIEQTAFSWGITLEQFNCPIDFPADSDVIEIADLIMEGKMIVLYSSEDMLAYNPDDMSQFDWNVQYSNSPNTFQLYLQCLNPVAYLTRGYELSGNERYLVQAQAILDSWISYTDCSSGGNPFLWYDHGTALRSETIMPL